MCGFVGVVGAPAPDVLSRATATLCHRGPDDEGHYEGPAALFGFRRLKIIDLTAAGHQPLSNEDGSLWICHNGEVYNYIELKQELGGHRFKSRTDSEVILHAYETWGEECLERFCGMFAFTIWDSRRRSLFAARDRFGVKPFYYSILPDGSLAVASEIKALHACGVSREPDPVAWATYFKSGAYDHRERTFWKNVYSLLPGHALRWKDGRLEIFRWYDLASKVDPEAGRWTEERVIERYRALLDESIRLRFRSDVPVGVNVSGGLDSSILLALVHAVRHDDGSVRAFTFTTGDERYDELPWVKAMLAKTGHPLEECRLNAGEVPRLAEKVQRFQDEPFGGFPTLAYSKVFEAARRMGVYVLLDGQGMDEQWAGYDYYERALSGSAIGCAAGHIQGSQGAANRPDLLCPDFLIFAEEPLVQNPFPDALTNCQYRDACSFKLPRALRFNDRISMMHGTELRGPFLDHRLFELAFSQPEDRKIRGGIHKWLLRRLAARLLPAGVVQAPKRPVQTPQREWLRGELKDWADAMILRALGRYGGTWLDTPRVTAAWENYQNGAGDNSFAMFQVISLGLMDTVTGV